MGEITIKGWAGAPIPAGKETMLDAALRAGAPVPYQCRSGDCGTCKCRLVAGRVRNLPRPDGALSEGEEALGYILPCRSQALDDVAVSYDRPLPKPRPAPRKISGEIAEVCFETPETLRLVVRMSEPLPFVAGQYVSLEVPGLPVRNYSPANAPGEACLEFFVRIVPDGQVSGHLAREAWAGEEVWIEGPHGSACLDAAEPGAPMLLAAGGAGLSPMLSMLRVLEGRAPEAQVWLYVGARMWCELIATPELDRLEAALPNLRVIRVLSDEDVPGQHSGFLGPVIASEHHNLEGMEIFIAGPPPMVAHVEEAVDALGADPGNVRTDPFTAAANARPLSGAVARLRNWFWRKAG